MGTKETLEAIRATEGVISALNDSREKLRQAIDLAEQCLEGVDFMGLFGALELISEADEDDVIGMAMVSVIYLAKIRYFCRHNEVPEENALIVGVKR